MKQELISQVRQKRVWGRTVVDTQPLSLYWTGSGIELIVKSSELWLEVEVDFDEYEPWLAMIINGAVVSRQMLLRGRYWLCLYRGLDASADKHVQIVKEVQAMSADSKHLLLIHAIRHNGSLLDVPQYEHRIEFIGDSITSGEGTIGAVSEQDWVSMWFSATENYTRYTSNLLDAEYRIISQSGWGVYSSWDYNTAYNIPSYYEQVCGVLDGDEQRRLGAKQQYDFSTWQPDFIVVNLGTNDASAYRLLKASKEVNDIELKQFIHAYEEAVYSFLTLLRRHNLNSSIIWAYGMLGDELTHHLIETIESFKVKTSDKHVYFCKLPSMDHDTIGSRQHPGQKLHIKAAHVLSNFIRNIKE